jgi:alkanesulfonate monooxygenase SsuD/methylene tetrahydromethanopterin reductase-like flavin-dependent oxidoreductase (luciferase family)
MGRLADGWFPLMWFPLMAPGPELTAATAAVADAATAAGRDPATQGTESRLSWHAVPDDLAEQARRWRRAGATHVWLNTMNAGCHLDAGSGGVGAPMMLVVWPVRRRSVSEQNMTDAHRSRGSSRR